MWHVMTALTYSSRRVSILIGLDWTKIEISQTRAANTKMELVKMILSTSTALYMPSITNPRPLAHTIRNNKA